MIVVLGLPLNVATIILGCIFSMLFSDFRARGRISIPTPPIVTSTEFFHTDAETNIHPLPVWTPLHGRAKAGWPARTYVQQLCEDTGCSPEDMSEVMKDRERWQERVRDILSDGTTRWNDEDEVTCVLVCIFCLCNDPSQKLSAPVVGLFYLKF